jgi:hypothetical protein
MELFARIIGGGDVAMQPDRDEVQEQGASHAHAISALKPKKRGVAP